MKLGYVLIPATAIALAGCTMIAQDRGGYANLGVKTIEFDTYSIQGRVGHNLNDVFAVEAEAAVGVIGDDEAGLETDENYSLGAFLKASAPINPRTRLFGRIGYSYSEFGLKRGTVSVDDGYDGLGFGGGVEFAIRDRNAIRLEYTGVDFGTQNGVDVGTADTLSASYVFKF